MTQLYNFSYTKYPKIFGITLDPKLTYNIIKAKQMLNILKACIFTKWGKQTKLIMSTFKAITCLILECGALSYQTPTSRNCKTFSTQLCAFLLTAHEIQTL